MFCSFRLNIMTRHQNCYPEYKITCYDLMPSSTTLRVVLNLATYTTFLEVVFHDNDN